MDIADEQLAGSLALQVSCLLLDDDGKLTVSIQAGRTLRAAVLADLVAAGALRNDAAEVEIEPVTGLLPLSARMSADMTAKPDEDLRWWAHHDGIGVTDAAAQLVDLGLWERHPDHFGLEHHYRSTTDRAELAARLRAAAGTSYADADPHRIAPNLALVGGLYGHQPAEPDADVIAELGRQNWLLPDLVDYLWESSINLRMASTAGYD